jgi:hypothetical protein
MELDGGKIIDAGKDEAKLNKTIVRHLFSEYLTLSLKINKSARNCK